ncbi:MAG TPA: hypothetical protein VNK91_00265 [Burkholderiaceae bacterium]|jgi:hypothetical protein|nr:hypothetical protein [Burkholderiaceae bacterium]
MKRILAALAAAAAAPVFAQSSTAPGYTQRDVNQEQRIEQGLQSGALSTREAARLQREQAHIDRLQARALADGELSAAERARINAAQNAASRDIYRQKHDAQTGDPNSPSSLRMQADVARNIAQEKRIQQGMASGELTNREAARLEAGQAHVGRVEARAGRDGHVGPGEQARIRHAQNAQSRKIYRHKHDEQRR